MDNVVSVSLEESAGWDLNNAKTILLAHYVRSQAATSLVQIKADFTAHG